jgi:hypothetical protein
LRRVGNVRYRINGDVIPFWRDATGHILPEISSHRFGLKYASHDLF